VRRVWREEEERRSEWVGVRERGGGEGLRIRRGSVGGRGRKDP